MSARISGGRLARLGRTKKNVSILSSWTTGSSSTSRMEAYPPVATLQCFSNASKICQPHSLRSSQLALVHSAATGCV